MKKNHTQVLGCYLYASWDCSRLGALVETLSEIASRKNLSFTADRLYKESVSRDVFCAVLLDQETILLNRDNFRSNNAPSRHCRDNIALFLQKMYGVTLQHFFWNKLTG